MPQHDDFKHGEVEHNVGGLWTVVETPNDTIRVRVGTELKQKIQGLVDSGEYDDISAFVRDAIREHMNPTRGIERTKRHIIYLVENDIDIQEALCLAKGCR